MSTTELPPEQKPAPRIWLSLRWQILLACIVPVLLMLGNAAIRTLALDRSLASTEWVAHTNQVIGEAAALARTITDAQSNERVFLRSRDPKRLLPFEAATSKFWRMSVELEALVSDNPAQVERARKIASQFEHWRTEVAEAAIRSAQPEIDIANDDRLNASIRDAVDEFIGIERGLLAKRRGVAESTIAEARGIATFGTAISVLVAVCVAVYLSYSVGSSLAELEAAAHELAKGDLRRRAVVARRDEIGRLAHFFNLMADALVARTRDSARAAALGQEFQMCFTIEEAASTFCRFARGLMPESTGAMFLTSASRNLLVKGFDWGSPSAETLVPEDCLALRKGHAHYVNDTILEGVCAHLDLLPPRSSACIPLMAHGETVGIVHVESATGDVASLRQVFAGTVAEQLALTVANLQLREKLYAQAIRDPLTGLFNRRYLEETLPREVARADRAGQTLGVLTIDIDHFKRFNDTFGHEAGDLVLREIGTLLRASFRTADISVRLGGEEFVVVLLDTDKDKLVRRAERLGDAVRSLALVHRELALGGVTVSIGVAIFPESARDADALLRVADVALYRAKNEGRDRAVVAERSVDRLPLTTLPPAST